jgi:virulence factor Mce-like protein
MFARTSSRVLDHPLPFAGLGLALLIALIITISPGGSSHRVTAVFGGAVSLVPGLDVQVDGVAVGKVDSIKLDGNRAVVALAISKAWPLPQGTTATIRWGSTLGLGSRYVELTRGPASAPRLSDGAVIPERQTTTPVELDQLYNTFDPATRAHLRGAVAGTQAAVQGQGAALGGGIAASAQALTATNGLLADLDQVEPQLTALVDQGARSTATLASRNGEIADLIGAASTTFTQFGTRTAAIQGALDQFAPALGETRTTLARAQTSLNLLDGLLTNLRPGLTALHPFIAAARPGLAGLRVLSPLGAATLQTLDSSAPSVTTFLRHAQPFSDQLQAVMKGLAPAFACIRPYTPEVAGLVSTWASWAQNYDNVAHYARVKANEGPSSLDSFPSMPTSNFLTLAGGGIKYAMPRPPGLNAGQPWLLPECGAGAQALDPNADPEQRR